MHDSTVAACRMPLAPGVCLGCRREQWRFPWILARKFKLLELFFGVPNRPEQSRPGSRAESRVARPNWTAGCPFFGQHDQVARFVYPSVRRPVPKVTKGQTMMPRLLSLSCSFSRSLGVSLSLSFSLLAGAFASVLVANQKSKSLLALATKRDAVGNADDDLLPLHAPCRMAFRRLYKLGQSTK